MTLESENVIDLIKRRSERRSKTQDYVLEDLERYYEEIKRQVVSISADIGLIAKSSARSQDSIAASATEKTRTLQDEVHKLDMLTKLIAMKRESDRRRIGAVAIQFPTNAGQTD